MEPRLLEGDVVDARDEVVLRLQTRIDRLEEELQDARQQAEIATRKAARSVKELRRQLLPLYRALQAVFGEIDVVVGDEPQTGGTSATVSAVDPRMEVVWASWKQRLGGTVAKGIDALLLHGALDTSQLAIAAGLDRRTVTNTVVYKLNQAGLITKENGRFSLKKL